MPDLTREDPIFSIFPIQEENTHIVSWVQKDNFTGLQALRGIGGAPTRVNRVGDNRFTMTPGVYGEYMAIDELALTAKADPISMRPVDLTSETAECQMHLLMRRLDRIRYIAWKALTGQFVVPNNRGLVHADAFAVQTEDAAVAWNDLDDSTPLKDLLGIKTSMARGRSCSFGTQAKLFMNSATVSQLLLNENPDDLGGKKLAGGGSQLGLGDVNRVLNSFGLPSIIEYDRGYFTEGTETWNMFIPDGKAALIGYRNGETPGAYKMTRNGQTGLPGAYTFVKDTKDEVPREVKVHDGHNGGPVLWYPGDIVWLSLY